VIAKQRSATDNESRTRQERSGSEKFDLPLFRRDSSNDPDSPFTFFKTPFDKPEIRGPIRDYVHTLARHPTPQRLRHRFAARRDHCSRSPQSQAFQVSSATLSDAMMRVEQHRHAFFRRQRRRHQHARTVHVNQVRFFGKPGHSRRLPGNVREKSQNVSRGLPAAVIRSARNLINPDPAPAKNFAQRPARWNRHPRIPASLLHRRQKIEQALLRAAQRVELIQKKDLHRRRTASASTHM